MQENIQAVCTFCTGQIYVLPKDRANIFCCRDNIIFVRTSAAKQAHI